MRVIYNRYLPFGKFTAINIFGVIFAQNKYRDLSCVELNHEKIHTRQIIELLGVFYYILYFFEWIIRILQYQDLLLAYRNISFEREAYDHDNDFKYLSRRRSFSFIRYYKERK